LLLAVAIGFASLATGGSSRADEKRDEAKRHFMNGVHLFEDRNLAGALVEFEASFEQNPTAVALQNIAVCQKGLFRYADAISTLERMLRQFGSQLSADDKRGAEDAIPDMNALLGSVVVKVAPAEAKVSINDAPLDPAALAAPIRLAAGEYRVAAEAPGYLRQEKRISVTSGQKESLVEMALLKSGALAPDQPPSSGETSPAAPTARGLYGFVSFGASSLGNDHPNGIVLEKPRTTGGFAVLRGGYRFSSLFGVELDLATSNHSVRACVDTVAECASPDGNYRLTSTRFGPAARFMTSGAKARIVGTVGIGAAVQHISYDDGLNGKDATGAGSYFELAAGYELSIGRLLLGVGLRLLAENAQKVGIESATSGGLDVGIGFADW
jgi:hypothetical protein